MYLCTVVVKLYRMQKGTIRAAEMAQWVKCLLLHHEDLSFDSQKPRTQSGWPRTHWSSIEAELEAEDQAERLRVTRCVQHTRDSLRLNLGRI